MVTMRHYRSELPVRLLIANAQSAGQLLVIIATTILALGWLREFYILITGSSLGFEFLRLFDTPDSLANWFQPIVLLIAAILLALIATLAKQDADPEWRRWTTLAALFAFMSLDESAHLHAYSTQFMENQFGTSNVFVVLTPIMMIAGTLSIYFARLLFRVPRHHAIRFACCGLLFVGGVLGVEIGSHFIGNAFGRTSVHYVLAASLEESLETVGATLFCLALISYLKERWQSWSITFN